MNDNLIEVIAVDLFKDLVSLEILYFSKLIVFTFIDGTR